MSTIQTAADDTADSKALVYEEPAFVGFRGARLGRFGAVLVVLAVAVGLSTFAILTGLTPIDPTRGMVITLLSLNGVIVTAMAGLMGWQVIRLLKARREHVAGAVLHSRIVGLFSLVAAVPAIIVATFATVTLNRGLDTWFSERTQGIVQTSVTVAEAYINEQKDLVQADVTGIAASISQNKKMFTDNRNVFLRQLATIVAIRNLTAAFVINRKTQKVEASITANRRVEFRPPGLTDFKGAAEGKVVIIGPGDGNVLRGLVKLKNFDEHYLYVYRLINPTVTAQLKRASAEVQEYAAMLNQRAGLQMTFAMMYIGVAFIFLLAAAWFGLWFADRLVEPIVALVRGSRQVSKGELHTKVPVRKGGGDLATLSRTFNQMTGQLESQRNELISTNDQLDQRRRFTEAVLSGVSAGVIGIDPNGEITLINRSGLKLLGKRSNSVLGKKFGNVLPAMVPFLEQAESKVSGRAEGHVSLRIGQDDRSFVVQVTTEKTGDDEHGVVVTFDDISDLVAAQRNSAWADIARRIAHEIKNPLTPIQLAAERLRRKYAKDIDSDPEVFNKCTETIIRQVGDIRGMVDEFSSFARMPSAVLEPVDITTIARDGIVLQKASFEDVSFDVDIPDGEIVIPADRRLVTQAITNLVKNAKESLDARLLNSPEPPKRIRFGLEQEGDHVVITVADNGVGLPKENRRKLTEPYMTTREKGTGLGLAIVKRIMEDHHGKITLDDAPDDFDGGMGAMVSLHFPIEGDAAGEKGGKLDGQKETRAQ